MSDRRKEILNQILSDLEVVCPYKDNGLAAHFKLGLLASYLAGHYEYDALEYREFRRLLSSVQARHRRRDRQLL